MLSFTCQQLFGNFTTCQSITSAYLQYAFCKAGSLHRTKECSCSDASSDCHHEGVGKFTSNSPVQWWPVPGFATVFPHRSDLWLTCHASMVGEDCTVTTNHDWLVVTGTYWNHGILNDFPSILGILGISYSELMNSYFSEGVGLNHQPDDYLGQDWTIESFDHQLVTKGMRPAISIIRNQRSSVHDGPSPFWCLRRSSGNRLGTRRKGVESCCEGVAVVLEILLSCGPKYQFYPVIRCYKML